MSASSRAAIRRLLPYALRHRRAFLLGLGCIGLTTAIQLLGPWVLKYAIDDLTVGVTRGKLAWYALLLLALAVVGGFFRFLMRRIIVGASREIEYDLRNDFFARLQSLPLAYYHGHRTGDLMSRATNDLNAVRMMAGPAVMYASSTTLVFIVAIIVMLSIDATLTGLALLPLPLVSLAVRYFGTAIHKRFEAIQEQLSDLSAVVQETLAGVRVVRAYGQEAAELDRFQRANDEYVARNRSLIRLQGFFYPTLGFFLGLAGLLVLWVGSRRVIAGSLTIGELVAFNSYVVMLSWPMIAFGWVTNMIQRGMASWKRMLTVLDAVPTIASPEQPYAPAPSQVTGRIEFRRLTFGYGASPVLHEIDLTIEPARTVALVGATGSGKSTLVNLVARLFDPPPGTVFVDGVDVREWDPGALRAVVGVVPQEPFLFSDSLGENIAFAPEVAELLPDARLPRVREVAAMARLDKDVDDFPKGYDTVIGERGLTLSGGQKQRTALARALASDPRILVLDDALSAVDTYTEEEILQRLRGVIASRTTLIVSHRISTVRDADLICVLHEGRIVERGRHAALVAHGGLYAALHRKQLLEEELAAS